MAYSQGESSPGSSDVGDGSKGSGRWTFKAFIAVALCFVINMIDGMDIVAMSYVGPALSRDWSLSPSTLGLVFSAGLGGMAIGCLLVAPLADRFGRKPLIMTALTLMSIGMVACGFVTNVYELMAARVVVGAGIGTVLTTMAALTAEVTPPKYRSLAVGIVQGGYPLAAVGTGLVVAALLPTHGWQLLLLWAGILTVVMLPAAWLILPKTSPESLRALKATSFGALVSKGFLKNTLLLWIAVFSGFMVLYYIVSWVPRLAIQAGLSETNGIYAGTLYNLGAFVGTVIMSSLSVRQPLTRIIPTFLVGATVAMLVFGLVPMSVALTLFTAFMIGVLLQGGFNGIYPLAASVYPEGVRATGIGWAYGIGRGGAVIGPWLGGYLIASGASLPVLFGVYAVPMLICAAATRLTTPAEPTHVKG